MKTRSVAAKKTLIEGRVPPALASDETTRVKAKVGERGQVVIPKAIRDRLAIGKDTEIEFQLCGNVLTLRPKKDMAALRKHLDKYLGSMAGQLKRDGYESVDDYMRVMRSR